MLSKNIFINYMKKSLVEGEIKRGVRAFEEVKALVKVLSLPILDF